MNNYRFLKFLLIALVLSPLIVTAQEEEGDDHEKEEQHRHSIGLTLSHSFIGKGLNEDGGRKIITVPSWGLKYNYHINEKWAIGWHNDLLIERFVIERPEEEGGSLERNFPIASLIMASHALGDKGWGFSFGAGIEWEENENFGVIRAGLEYAVELPKKWEVVFEGNYDIMIEAYDSFTLGICIYKLF